MKKHLKYCGFTLAEVLITLGIIGIVAALTIPNLVANYQKKIYVVQLQKVYSQLSQAVIQFKADQNVDNLTKTYLTDISHAGVGTFFKTYFKVVKDCGVYSYKTGDDCVADSYTLLDGSLPFDYSIMGYCVTLNSGASICMTYMCEDYSHTWTGNMWHGRSYVVVDVNGKNGPNRAGRDFFTFELYSDGKIGESYNIDKSDRCLDEMEMNSYAPGCFDKIRKDGWKMDY